jgi:hypothetical protein
MRQRREVDGHSKRSELLIDVVTPTPRSLKTSLESITQAVLEANALDRGV